MDLKNIEPHDKFDFLRGMAALVVLAGHVLAAYLLRFTGKDSRLYFVSEFLSSHAVLVFFLLSGYLITASIIRNINLHGSLDVRQYLTDRIARIYPPLLGAIAVCLGCWAVIYGFSLPGSSQTYGIPSDLYRVGEYYRVTPKDILFAPLMLTSLQNADGPLWSLRIEVIDYALVMFAFLAMTKARKKIKVLSVVVILLLCVAGQRHINSQFLFYTSMWGMGSLAALLNSRWPTGRSLLGLKSDVTVTVLTCLLFIFGGRYAIHTEAHAGLSYAVRAMFCVLYAYMMFIGKTFERWPYKKALLRPARYSYSLYIIHFPLLLFGYSLTQGWMGASVLRSCIVAAGACGVIVLTARCFASVLERQSLFKPWIRRALSRFGGGFDVVAQ